MSKNSNLIPFTPTAYQQMVEERNALETEHEEVMERLKTAREMGDLSENGAYKYAKFELGRITGRLRYLDNLLTRAQVQEKHNASSIVEFGSIVTLTNPSETLTFTIVSGYESDISQQKLSMSSPLGSAVMGKKVGDTISVSAPAGMLEYTITTIE